MRKLVITILFSLILYITPKLLHVSVMYRHGARTMGNYYEEYKKLFLGIGESELTPNGFTQEMLLGRYLRYRYIKNNNKKYKGFLPKKFNEKSVNFKVSETQRTIFSSIGLLSGLYSDAVFLLDKGGNVSNHNLPPIKNFNFNVSLLKNETFQIVPKDNDVFFHANECFEKDKILYNYTDQEKQIIDKLESIFPEIINDIRNNSYSVKRVKGFMDVVIALDNLVANYSMSIYDEETKELFRKTVLYAWYKNDMSDEKAKMLSSLMLDDLKKNMLACLPKGEKKLKFLSEESVDSHDNCTKINFFAFHDTNIVEILRNLLDDKYVEELREQGVKNETIYKLLVPPYATSLIFELHSDDFAENAYYVKMLLNGEEPFTRFRNLTYNMTNGLVFEDFSKLLDSRFSEDIFNIDCRRNSTPKPAIF